MVATVARLLNQAIRSRLMIRAARATRRFAMVEELEQRVLLSVTGQMSSTVDTTVYPTNGIPTWIKSGVVHGPIAPDTYDSDSQFMGSHSHAGGWTDGTDPGWLGTGVHLCASSSTLSSETQGFPASGMTTAFVDYVVSIRPKKALPSPYEFDTIYIPITSKFNLGVTITGDPGKQLETGTARAYAEVCLSDGAQHQLADNQVDWVEDQAKAVGGTINVDISPSFSNTLAYSPVTTGSDYLCVHFTAANSSMVAVTQEPLVGTMTTSSLAWVSSIAFDQAAFNTTQGLNSFQLSDYFELVYGWDPAFPVPGQSTTSWTSICDTPAVADPGGTGDTGTGTTGDTTPTFTGLAFSGTKPMKTGKVIIYFNGVEAARGTVTNGIYLATLTTPQSAGTYSVTASVGTSAAKMGPKSSPLSLTIDTSLPAGDTLDVALGVGGAKSVTFVDGDGTKAVLKLTAGTATLHFAGNGILQTGTTALTISAQGAQLTGIDVTGDTSTASLTVTGSKTVKTGNATINVGAISVAGPIAKMTLTAVDLHGNLTIGGKIGTLTLNSITGAALQATSIGNCKLAANLQASTLTLSQAVVPADPKVLGLGTLTVGGTVSGSPFAVAGSVGKVVLQQASASTLTAGGAIASLAATGLSACGVSAASIGTLSVSGTVLASIVQSTGNIGTVKAGQLLSSTLFAGVDPVRNAPGVLPDESLDFAVAATLGTLTLSGVKGQSVSLRDSYVAASKLGKIVLSGLPTDGTATGGVAGHQLLTQYSRTAGKLPKITKGPQTTAQMLDTLGTFVAKLV